MIEQSEIEESNMYCTIDEEITIPPMCCGDFPSMLNYADFNGERLTKLKQAHLRFKVLSKVSYQSSFEFETRHYRELYEDINAHHDFWFNKLFQNPAHAYKATGILGTLCTILRQWGDLEGCMEVMSTYTAVLKIYQQLSEGSGDEDEILKC